MPLYQHGDLSIMLLQNFKIEALKFLRTLIQNIITGTKLNAKSTRFRWILTLAYCVLAYLVELSVEIKLC